MTQSPNGATQSSHLSRRWLVKMMMISAALIAFGFWGLYDAKVKYPARGREAAEYLELQYLQALETAGQLSRASIEDPTGRLKELERKQKEGPLPPVERAAYEWLDQLNIIQELESASESTRIPRDDFRAAYTGQAERVSDPLQRLSDLKKSWTTAAGTMRSAAPLSAFDLGSQWVIFYGGLGLGIYILGTVAVAKSRVYRWDPAEQRLTVPGGISLVPSDIEEFDKRKWHRLYITLKVKNTHPQAPGKAFTIDLLRYEPVESWVLEMERTAFPESESPPPAEQQPAAAAQA